MSKSGLVYSSTKTYTHAEGLSCCFRQWRATHSHCQWLHGYAIQVEVEFWTKKLDERNWVVDYGGMKDFKQWLKDNFDHKTIIARDDPAMDVFLQLNKDQKTGKIIDLLILPNVGMEAFAEYVYCSCSDWLFHKGLDGVLLHHVKLWEHPGNAAAVYNPILVVNP